MKTETCESCKFWKRDRKPDSVFGNCRFKAPFALPSGAATIPPMVLTVWPETHQNAYCGDYKANPEAV